MDKEAEAQCFTTSLIERDGSFNAHGLDNFIKKAKLQECGLSYAIVAVMGPQSSGKSTLLNHLFHTSFREMDAYEGRTQTTKGIWIARCTDIEPCTIVMDLEGTDGRERGEDDTVFERQSALFAIVLSDIMLINMWCKDIGREHAANIPLLKNVFQVMLQLCRPRKTTLMFVIRDKTKTPFETLECDLREGIKKIWDSVPKAEAHKHTQLSEFFNVEVVALSSYEDKEDEFKEQVANLRQKFFRSIAPGGLAGDRRWVVPPLGFSLHAQQIWKLIKENKDLDLPSHRVMVATVRCEEIATDKYSSLAANQDWLKLREAVKTHLVPGFGEKLSLLICNCLANYDEDVIYFEEIVRSAKRKQLKEKLMELVRPTVKLMLKHIRSKTMNEFESALNNALSEGQGFAMAAHDCTIKWMTLFDERCEDATRYKAIWDYTKIRDKFAQDLDSRITEVRSAKLNELTTQYELQFKHALCSQVEARLKEANDNTWPTIKTHFDRESRVVVLDFSVALSGFKMDKQEEVDMISKLKNYGRGLVEEKAREEAGKVNYLMKQRFELIFCHGNDSKPRDWTQYHDIRAITKTAQSSSLKLLSVLAAIRLDGETDRIWHTLKKGTTTSPHLLDPNTWEKVPTTRTLITPAQCKDLWDRFKVEIEYTVNQANALQEKVNNKKKKKLKMWATKAACIAISRRSIVGSVSVVGMISIAAATSSGNVVVVAAAGVLGGVVLTGVLVSFTAHSVMALVKNSVFGKLGYNQ